MALAMLPRYDGRLGDALVGLGVLRSMELFRAVAEQVRSRYLEAFRWDRGQWAFVDGERCDEETFPIGQHEHELLRDAAMQPTSAQMEAALTPIRGRVLRPHPAPPAPISSYRLPADWEQVIRAVEREPTLDRLLVEEHEAGLDPEHVRRAVYLGLSCELIDAA